MTGSRVSGLISTKAAATSSTAMKTRKGTTNGSATQATSIPEISGPQADAAEVGGGRDDLGERGAASGRAWAWSSAIQAVALAVTAPTASPGDEAREQKAGHVAPEDEDRGR